MPEFYYFNGENFITFDLIEIDVTLNTVVHTQKFT